MGWEFGVLVNPNNKDQVKCILCDKVMCGGVYRLKQHITQEGKNAKKCQGTKTSKDKLKEAQEKCKKALDEAKRKREKKTVRELELREKVHVSRVGTSQEVTYVESRFKDVIAIVEKKMAGRLDSPLHLAAYLLNPRYSYADPSIFDVPKITVGFISCVETFYYHDEEMQEQAANVEL